MRRVVLMAVAVAGAGVALSAGTSLANANDRDDRVASPAGGPAFELEIDPELDARFGPRPVNAVRAAEIVTARFGGRVVEAELDEENGRPIWEMKLVGAGVAEVDVDATNGAILGGDDDDAGRDDDAGDDDDDLDDDD
jgi:uncharacterized membrane protein YkoI